MSGRKRSPSKTQTNYNPMNATALSALQEPHEPPFGSSAADRAAGHDNAVVEIPLESDVSNGSSGQSGGQNGGQNGNNGGQNGHKSGQNGGQSGSHRNGVNGGHGGHGGHKSAARASSSDASPALQSFVHVVKLNSFENPDVLLKILAIPLAPDSLKIGRQNTPKATNKITDGFFDSRVLSRNHAELFIKENKLYIKDLKSSNGTFINDQRLDPYKDYELHVGDKLDLGTTLESQVAHKKITCVVAEFNYVPLDDYRESVGQIVRKDDLEQRKLELFNSTVDALIFGELVDERQQGDSLQALLDSGDGGDDDDDDKENVANMKHDTVSNQQRQQEKPTNFSSTDYVSGLNVKGSTSMQEIICKLAVAVNNEYVQQQRLQQLSKFLKSYNGDIVARASNKESEEHNETHRQLLLAQSQLAASEKRAVATQKVLETNKAELAALASTTSAQKQVIAKLTGDNEELKKELEQLKQDLADSLNMQHEMKKLLDAKKSLVDVGTDTQEKSTEEKVAAEETAAAPATAAPAAPAVKSKAFSPMDILFLLVSAILVAAIAFTYRDELQRLVPT